MTAPHPVVLTAIGVAIVAAAGFALLARTIRQPLILGYIVKAVVGLRPTQEDEETGLDLTDHGERGYHMTET